jgi:hypothetical protein
MRRALALSLRILVTGILAYRAIGVAYRIADELAYFPPSPTADIPPFWASPSAFLVWFVLLALLWPFSVAEFLDGGRLIAVALFVAMFAVIYGTLAFVARRRVARALIA